MTSRNMHECKECYSSQKRITPLLNPRECPEGHIKSFQVKYNGRNTSERTRARYVLQCHLYIIMRSIGSLRLRRFAG